MPTFERCDESVNELAKELLGKYETHKPLNAAGIKIDYVFAYSDKDEETGRPLNDALSKNGIKALGICRKLSLKDRALGRGDAEISLDGDHWRLISGDVQAALLDHELHHIAIKSDKAGNIQFDDLGRPQIKLRKHDIEVGWFSVIAERHGAASIERKQAASIMDMQGQTYWPDICPTITISSGDQSVTTTAGKLKAIAKGMARKV